MDKSNEIVATLTEQYKTSISNMDKSVLTDYQGSLKVAHKSEQDTFNRVMFLYALKDLTKVKYDELMGSSELIESKLVFYDKPKLDNKTQEIVKVPYVHYDLYQDDMRLRDMNILNPEWVTNGVYKILNSPILFNDKGILDVNKLDEILDNKEFPRNTHSFIIGIMKKFELCFELDGDGQKYLVPDLLSKDESKFDWDYDDSLQFQYHYDFLPSSVISRFIVKTNEFRKDICWRSGVVLGDGNNEGLIKADMYDKKIFIYITGQKSTRREFLAQIRFNFEAIHKTIAKIVAREMIPLPDNLDVVVDYNHLLKLEKLGETTYFPTGADRKYNIKELLAGIETGYDITAILKEIVNFLLDIPTLQNERGRRALLSNAGLSKLIPSIDCSGDTKTFITLLVEQLYNYGTSSSGQNALIDFLNEIASESEVGLDKRKILKGFCARLDNKNVEAKAK